MAKQNYEVRVAYVVYDYYNVVAESEDEAKVLAKRYADQDSLNDFQMQRCEMTIKSVKDVDGKAMVDMGGGEYFNGLLRIRFGYGGENYSFPVLPEDAEDDPDLEDSWLMRLHPNTNENITFVLMGHYTDNGDLATSAPLQIRVEDKDCDKESYIDDIDIY